MYTTQCSRAHFLSCNVEKHDSEVLYDQNYIQQIKCTSEFLYNNIMYVYTMIMYKHSANFYSEHCHMVVYKNECNT
jgi:hypothetical protein